jgi:hypothetical protein
MLAERAFNEHVALWRQVGEYLKEKQRLHNT